MRSCDGRTELSAPAATPPVIREKEKVAFLHTPKTGGAHLEYYLYERFRHVRRNYFLSFAGVDDSQFIKDDRSTPAANGNKCVIERAFIDPDIAPRFEASPHFHEAKVVFGHATFALGDLFPKYGFQYLMVVREPVERTISNILQFSADCNPIVKFGGYRTRHAKYTDAYWDFIYDVLSAGLPVDGLLNHEQGYLSDCMTRILQGSKYLDPTEAPNLRLALVNAMRCQISFFDDLNAGIQRSFAALGIDVDMSGNVRSPEIEAMANPNRQRYGRFYNAPQKVIDLVGDHNRTDIKLYGLLKERLAPGAGHPDLP